MNPMEQFEVKPALGVTEPLFHIGGNPIYFTNQSLLMVIVTLAAATFLTLAVEPGALVPGKGQSMAEISYEFVANMIHSATGEAGLKFFPFVFSLFIFVLFCNFFGMIPGSFTVTSQIAVTLTLACLVMLVVIVTGFQGIDPEGNITTLGRGGSDTSAVAVAAALKAAECLIYTDVDGVYTTDPRVVPAAKRLGTVSFEEMLEMASLGSKVLQIRSVEFAGKHKVPMRVLSSFTPWDIDLEEEAKSGTLITFEEDEKMEAAVVSGIAFSRDEAKITLLAVPDKPGIAFSILGPVAAANIDVDMIVQNQSVAGTTDFSFTVNRNEFARAVDLLKREVIPAVGARELSTDEKVAKVSIVGIGMRSHVGVASLMFQTLSQEGINIQMISTSEIKTSVIIDDKYMELGVRALHKAFGLDQAPAAKA